MSSYTTPTQVHETTQTGVENKDESFKNLKLKLEKEGMEKVAELQKQNTTLIPMEEKITTILQSGFDEFEKKTGRGMTYSEMREMYG